MTDYRSLPGLHSNPIDPRTGRWTDPWLKYLRDLAKQGSESSDQSAAIEQISDRVTALEQHESDASIQGLNSVAVSGTLADGLVQVALRGDSASPGALRYYGTDEDGTKGFHAILDDAVPYLIQHGETYTVRENKQVPFTIPIDIGLGSGLIVEGILVEVD